MTYFTDITLKELETSDLKLLQELSIQTFTETFSNQNTEANMQLYLSENLNNQKLLEELQDDTCAFYFAYYKNELAGYLKLKWEPSSLNKDKNNLLEIERIYILQAFQRLSIGKYLLNFSKQIAKTKHAKGIYLGVWEHNIKAISFYKKHNFTQTGSHIFKLGDDEQTDLTMELLF